MADSYTLGKYDKAEEALLAALILARKQTAKYANQHPGWVREYGGWVYKTSDGKYAFTIKAGSPAKADSTEAEVNPGKAPSGSICASHSHTRSPFISELDRTVLHDIQTGSMRAATNRKIDQYNKLLKKLEENRKTIDPAYKSRLAPEARVPISSPPEWGTLLGRPGGVAMIDPQGSIWFWDLASNQNYLLVPSKTFTGDRWFIKVPITSPVRSEGLGLSPWGPGLPGVDPHGIPGYSGLGGTGGAWGMPFGSGRFWGMPFYDYPSAGGLFGGDGDPFGNWSGMPTSGSQGHLGQPPGMPGSGIGSGGGDGAPSDSSQGVGWTHPSEGAEASPPSSKETAADIFSAPKEETKYTWIEEEEFDEDDPEAYDDTEPPPPPDESGAALSWEGGDGGPVTEEEKAQAARAMFGDLVDQLQAERDALAEEIGFDKAGLKAWARQLVLGGSFQGHDGGPGDDVPSEAIARLRDVLGEEAAFITAAQKAAQTEYLFESGIFDPDSADLQVATADGQLVAVELPSKRRS